MPLSRFLAVDRDRNALGFWAALGVSVESEARFCSQVHRHPDRFDVVPCDEYLRANHPELKSSWTDADCATIHQKMVAHGMLQGRLKQCSLPALLPPVVIRPVRGAGSRGLYKSGPDEVVTEAVPVWREAVVDFNTRAGLYLPRLTHHMKNGADTSCTLLGSLSPEHAPLACAAAEVAILLGIDGVGNAQFIQDHSGKWWFVEASARVSGSSWLNLQMGSNVLLGTRGPEFDRKVCTTLGGGLFA